MPAVPEEFRNATGPLRGQGFLGRTRASPRSCNERVLQVASCRCAMGQPVSATSLEGNRQRRCDERLFMAGNGSWRSAVERPPGATKPPASNGTWTSAVDPEEPATIRLKLAPLPSFEACVSDRPARNGKSGSCAQENWRGHWTVSVALSAAIATSVITLQRLVEVAFELRSRRTMPLHRRGAHQSRVERN